MSKIELTSLASDSLLLVLSKVKRVNNLTYEPYHGVASNLVVNSLNQKCASAISSSYAEAIAEALNWHDTLLALAISQAEELKKLRGEL